MQNKIESHSIKTKMLEQRLHKVRNIYLTLILIGVMALTIKALGYSAGNLKDIGGILIQLLIFVFIYSGLRKKGEWVVPLILIVSAYGVLKSFLAVLVPASDLSAIGEKFVSVGFFIFFGYQLKLFSNKSVRNYYGEKGPTFF